MSEITARCTIQKRQTTAHLWRTWSVTVTAIIVTNCTQRKSHRPETDLVQLRRLQDLGRLAAAWHRCVSRAPLSGPAGSLYQGRSITDTTAAAAHLGTSWYVVSAGLGLVCSDQPVPTYECTVAPGTELGRRLELSGATAADWWYALNAAQPHPLSRLIARSPTLLALPGTYLRMVQEDLAKVSSTKAKQLRIFTSASGAQIVPSHLVKCVMPYDDRLESVQNYAGTQSDFAQRALRHFVESLGATMLPLDEARAIVSASLDHQPRRTRSTGTRTSDEEIRRLVAAQWARHAGRSTRLLRYLRDEAGISCEQKRFSRLWQVLAAEMRT